MAVQLTGIHLLSFLRQSREAVSSRSEAPTHRTWESERGIHPSTAGLKPIPAAQTLRGQTTTISAARHPATS